MLEIRNTVVEMKNTLDSKLNIAEQPISFKAKEQKLPKLIYKRRKTNNTIIKEYQRIMGHKSITYAQRENREKGNPEEKVLEITTEDPLKVVTDTNAQGP